MKRLVALLAHGLVALLSAAACSDWPPESEGGGSGGSNDFPIAEGSCSGTPVRCEQLNGAQCESVFGCEDRGVCSGSGLACGTERSYASCEAATGCYWSAACSGVPMGCFPAGTRAICEAMPGCVWIPRDGTGGAGSGGSSGGTGGALACRALGSPCLNVTNCDCNLSCVELCTSCQRICARTCQTDDDCASAGGFGVKTPYCVQTNPSAPKICAAAR